MGKYSKNNVGKILLLIFLTLFLVALILSVNLLEQWYNQQDAEQETQSQQEQVYMELSDGLRILSAGKYAGMYIEDGTNEIVMNVMMVILENTGTRDLQLARIRIQYASATAEFEVTNLPAGEKVVLLEKNRMETITEKPLLAEMQDVAFFPENMKLQADRIQVAGSNGKLEITNVSGGDITGDIYVYYKNSASDLLYGGITYRTSIKGGLKAGETAQVIAGHYSSSSSRVLMVDIVG